MASERRVHDLLWLKLGHGMWLAHGSRCPEWPASMGIVSFARPGLDPFGMGLAPGSSRSEWPSRVGIMGVGGLGLCPLGWPIRAGALSGDQVQGS